MKYVIFPKNPKENNFPKGLVVDLYLISKDTIIPEDVIDSELYNIPEGYYAIEDKDPNSEFLFKALFGKNYTLKVLVYLKESYLEREEIFTRPKYPRSLLVELYPIWKDTIIPEDVIDPEIYDIPEGYYAIIPKSPD